MDENGSGKKQYKISNVTAGFIIGLALLMDGLQFLLTLTVIGAPLSILITFFAACIFGVWFAILGVNYFSGKKKGLKSLSAISALVVEFVPIVSGIPAITAGVLGIILSTRLEDRKKVSKAPSTSNHVKFSGPQKLPSAANTPYHAANDNDEEEEYSRAA